jgi:hypothetical protein
MGNTDSRQTLRSLATQRSNNCIGKEVELRPQIAGTTSAPNCRGHRAALDPSGAQNRLCHPNLLQLPVKRQALKAHVEDSPNIAMELVLTVAHAIVGVLKRRLIPGMPFALVWVAGFGKHKD